MKICNDHNGQINLRSKQKYEVLSATTLSNLMVRLQLSYEASFGKIILDFLFILLWKIIKSELFFYSLYKINVTISSSLINLNNYSGTCGVMIIFFGSGFGFEAVCISHSVNTSRKSMNSTILSRAIDK